MVYETTVWETVRKPVMEHNLIFLLFPCFMLSYPDQETPLSPSGGDSGRAAERFRRVLPLGHGGELYALL